ncbi:phosphoglucosamine mutase [Anaplasma marginale]
MNIFGTDGVRGRANAYPMDPITVLRLGMAIGLEARKVGARVVVGKDTRISGYMVESALVSGLVAMGVNVGLLGPMPTAAIATLVRNLRASMGVVISASHNSYLDNGVKIFDSEGIKIPLELEEVLESNVRAELSSDLAQVRGMGKVYRIAGAVGRYIEFVKGTFPKKLKLSGMKIVVDCANGAAYHIGGEVFWELGADVVVIGNKPDGLNINHNCGSLHPEGMVQKVLKEGADIGIALDGDADRVVVCDEKGRLVDGDQVIASIMRHLRATKSITDAAVTTMSSKSMDRYARELGVRLHRSEVGDRHLVDTMRQHSCSVGGEKSGHIILWEHSTTSDSLVAALQILSIMLLENKSASSIFSDFVPMPRVHRDIPYSMEFDHIARLIGPTLSDVEQALGRVNGRVIFRRSGTERLIRCVIEGEDPKLVALVADELSIKLRELGVENGVEPEMQ